MDTRKTVIAAVAENGIAGKNNDLPWTKDQIPRDLPHFFLQTKLGGNTALIMGRGTLDSFGGTLLPGRKHIVISQTLAEGEHQNGMIVFSDMESADEYASENFSEVFFIGGPTIWSYGLKVSDRALITRVKANIEGDTCFPLDELDSQFASVFRQPWIEKEPGKLSATLDVLVRR